MDEVEFIPVELMSEICDLKIKKLVEILLEMDDRLESSSGKEICQKDAA